MNNKEYYNPDIEDFYIGFEGEINWNRGYEDKFEPFKIEIKDDVGIYHYGFHELLVAMDDGYGEVRVSYLTKEQIVTEGWICIDEKNNQYKKLNHVLIYKYQSKELQIADTDSSYGYQIKFVGFCNSINELRQIMKLIKL